MVMVHASYTHVHIPTIAVCFGSVIDQTLSYCMYCLCPGSHRAAECFILQSQTKSCFCSLIDCKNWKKFFVDITLVKMLLTAVFLSSASQPQPNSCPRPLYYKHSPLQHQHPCHSWPSAFSASSPFSSPLSSSTSTPHRSHLYPI